MACSNFAELREKWPLAFPVQHQDVRPLAMGVARQVAAAMGWSLPYTLGVLGRWKMAAVYCQAVLSYDQRIALDGSPAETVDAEAKDLATKQLAQLAAHKAAKKAAEAAAPAVAKQKPAPTANSAQDAGAIARPGARWAVAPARIAARKRPGVAFRPKSVCDKRTLSHIQRSSKKPPWQGAAFCRLGRSSQQPKADVHHSVHEVLARLARIVLRTAKRGAEHQHGTECPIDAEVQIAVGEGREGVLKVVGHWLGSVVRSTAPQE
jgi:sRNA-binding protein